MAKKMVDKASVTSIEKSEKLRCKKCNSSFGYLRIKDKAFCCRSCGYIDKEVNV